MSFIQLSILSIDCHIFSLNFYLYIRKYSNRTMTMTCSSVLVVLVILIKRAIINTNLTIIIASVLFLVTVHHIRGISVYILQVTLYSKICHFFMNLYFLIPLILFFIVQLNLLIFLYSFFPQQVYHLSIFLIIQSFYDNITIRPHSASFDSSSSTHLDSFVQLAADQYLQHLPTVTIHHMSQPVLLFQPRTNYYLLLIMIHHHHTLHII